MESKSRILVNFVNEYEIENGAKGVSVQYMFLNKSDSLDVSTNLTGSSGSRCAKVSLPYDSRSEFSKVPAIYDGDFTMSIGADGKPVLKLVGVKYVSDVTIKPLASK